MGYPGKDEEARTVGRKGNVIDDISLHILSMPHLTSAKGQSFSDALQRLESVAKE